MLRNLRGGLGWTVFLKCPGLLLVEWGMKVYINMLTKKLVSDRDTSKISKILVFKFPNDFGIKPKLKFKRLSINS